MTEACPSPPEVLPEPRARELSIIEPGESLGRIFPLGGDHPQRWDTFRHWGSAAGCRFDHHPGRQAADHPDHGIQYLALPRASSALTTCVAEVYQSGRLVDRRQNSNHFVTWSPTRSLRLLDLISGWVTRAGGNNALSSGAHAISREWARAIHTMPAVDGIACSSAVYPPGRCVALFERAMDALPETPALTPLALTAAALDGALALAANELGYRLLAV